MNDVDKIKQKTDIVQLISEYVPLKKTGRNYKACCPFHNEKTPSFIVSPERQIWHCFGCNLGGDCFKFLMLRENIEFAEALRLLAQKAGVTITQKFDAGAAKTKERIYQINHLASEYYHYLLLHHPVGEKARQYILDRGIKEKSLETFKIGYAPNSWDSLMKFLQSKGYTKEEMAEAGLIIKSEKGQDYYDRFRDRLMFTLKDHRGNVVAFAGRKIPSTAGSRSEDEKEAKYINTAETPVYIKGDVLYGLELTRDAIKKANQAIVVEGELDLISSWQTGITNVVAIKGSAFTENQVQLLKRFASNILLALDADLAGDLAARRGIALAEKAGFNIKVITVTKGKDPADCIKSSPVEWKKAVQNASGIYDFYISKAINKYNPQTAEGKKQISEEILPFLKEIDNLVVQAHYVKQLSKILETGEEVLYDQMKKLRKEEFVPLHTTKEQGTSVKTTRRELLEGFILGYFLQNSQPEKLLNAISIANLEFRLPGHQRVVNKLEEFLKSKKEWDIKKFIATLPQELISVCDVCYLWDIEDDDNADEDLTKVLTELKSLNLRERLNQLSIQMKAAKTEDEQAVLSKEFKNISQKLHTEE